jgi:uracil-DNA glycosylase
MNQQLQYRELSPLPMRRHIGASGANVIGREFVLYDALLRAEILATVLEHQSRRTNESDEEGMWLLRLDEGEEPGLPVWIRADGASHLGRWKVLRPADHPVDRIVRAITQGVTEWPAGTRSVPGRIPGTGFFPGASGLWREPMLRELPPLPVGGIMIVGQDFHSHRQYQRSLERGAEDLGGSTWSALRRLLLEINISEGACFFTNAYLGLRTGDQSVGDYPGARNTVFVATCRNLLARQLVAQRPRVVITLGLPAARMVGSLAPLELASWKGARSFTQIDDADMGVLTGVSFPMAGELGAGVITASTVALVHPSYRKLNVGRRRFRTTDGVTLEGPKAERAMLDSALVALGEDRWA